MDDQKYLVRFAQNYLFVRKTADSPVAQGSRYLSTGTQFSFLAAAEVTRRLRAAGYGDAVVANLRGEPVTMENVNQAESYNEIETASVWAEPVSDDQGAARLLREQQEAQAKQNVHQ